jgi:hypothetical protein
MEIECGPCHDNEFILSYALQLVSCGLRANAVCSQQRDAFGRCVGAAAAARAIPCADQARPCH